MSPLRLIYKTYPFLILRLVLAGLYLIPIFKSVRWGLSLYHDLFGETTLALELMAVCISLSAVYFVLKYITTIVLHLLQFIHTASMTLVIKDEEIKGAGVLQALALTMSRLGSVSVLLIADSVITESYKKLISWWISLDKIPKLLKSGLLFVMLKRSIGTIVMNISETVISYLFYNQDEKFFKGTAKSMLYIAKSWKSIIKTTFIYTLVVTCVMFLADIALLVYIVVDKWNSGLEAIVVGYVIAKLFLHLLKTALIEPLLTASMLCGFYDNIDIDSLEDTEVDSLVNKFPKFESHLLRANKRNSAVTSLTEAIRDLIPDDLKNISETVEKLLPRGARQNGNVQGITEEVGNTNNNERV